jgi:hypothetical protein
VTELQVRTASDEVWARLSAISNVNAFDGEVDIPDYDADDADTHRFWDLDVGGRPVNVHAYLVFHPSPGQPLTPRLSRRVTGLAWTFQVTAVGTDRTTVLWCVDKIRGAIQSVRIPLEGHRTGLIGQVGNPGPIQKDPDAVPARRYTPLEFGVYLAR